MLALYFFLAILSLMTVWFGTAAIMAFTFWLVCLLFGKNPAAAAIPNKAVWG